MLGEGQVETFNMIAEGARQMGLIEEAPDFQRMINPNYLR